MPRTSEIDGCRGNVHRVLKRDLLGVVELLHTDVGLVVCRRPTLVPVVGWIASALARREQRALRALAGLDGVPAALSLASTRWPFARSWIEGETLAVVHELRTDFFDLLEALVARIHASGVCHNDLHKEGNILVRPDGTPAILDFQLASIHVHRAREFGRRAAEDLRHVRKHRAAYVRAMGGTVPALSAPRPRTISRVWRRAWKPLYNRLMRLTGLRRWLASGEPERRRHQWPKWVEVAPPPGNGGTA
ncbi:MAG: phosphotransferase [Planctomycetota bacterium]